MKSRLFNLSILCLLFAFGASAATLTNFPYKCVTNNSGQCSLLENLLSVTATDNGSTVTYRFENNAVGYNPVISEIYFDDRSGFLSFATPTFVGSPGVKFSIGGSPSNLPGANNASPSFSTTLNLFATANSPSPKNGIGVGEYLEIKLNVATGKTFAAALLVPGGVRAGVHVQQFIGGNSESLVDDVPTSVPEPVTMALIGAGLVGLACSRRINTRI